MQEGQVNKEIATEQMITKEYLKFQLLHFWVRFSAKVGSVIPANIKFRIWTHNLQMWKETPEQVYQDNKTLYKH